ncbi:MAG: c-type cytochrome [Thermodesulfobacteriota bacterium]
MKKNNILFTLVIILLSAIAGGSLSLLFSKFIHSGKVEGHKSSATPGTSITDRILSVSFNPPQPQEAPPDIKNAVMLGYNILMDTQNYAPQYAGNKMKCRNCHFEAGRMKDGVSLVGVGATYPRYRERHRDSINLVRRTNDCFERSLNGRALPYDSKEMNAVFTYLHWISKGLPVYADIPWLGLRPIKTAHKPNPIHGKEVYDQKCMSCHGDNGEGTQIAPPLWGKDSFNDGASMAQQAYFAAFTHKSMPLGNPRLGEGDSIDVAAFTTGQPRPHFVPKNGG